MIKLTITSANDGWVRIRFVCDGKHEEKPYFLGNLAPHSDDLPELIEGFRRAGWTIDDQQKEQERTKKKGLINCVRMGNT